MLEAIKSVLKQAAHARHSGEAAEAERLYKEAAADAKAKDDVIRAEALLGVAQSRRDQGDRISAAINYAEAITILRGANATPQLAFALRHAADIRSELREFAVAASHIDEAARLYRSLDPPAPLDLANALRVAALNSERQAYHAWAEAQGLYAAQEIPEAVEDCAKHLDCLKHHEFVQPEAKQ